MRNLANGKYWISCSPRGNGSNTTAYAFLCYYISMESYILDTNLFFNMEANLGLGNKSDEVIKTLTDIIQFLKIEKKAEFYMPPRIVDEMLTFFDNPEETFLKTFFSGITIKSPDYNEIELPALVFQQYVDETRSRAYRGLNVAEEEIKKAGQLFAGKETLPKKEFEMTIGPIIKTFRERYRNATRTGFIDSLGDLDLIMLAKEMNGYLISTDEGVIRWGRILGVKEMPVSVFGQKMRDLAKK